MENKGMASTSRIVSSETFVESVSMRRPESFLASAGFCDLTIGF